MRLILIAFLLAQIAQAEPTGEYVERFQEALKRHVGTRLTEKYMAKVVFRIKPLWINGDDARCIRTFQNFCTEKLVIELDSWMWRRANDLYREMVVFHELGHCLLSRDHEPEKIGGVPKSLMIPEGLDWKTYLIYRERYHRELFKRLGYFGPPRNLAHK